MTQPNVILLLLGIPHRWLSALPCLPLCNFPIYIRTFFQCCIAPFSDRRQSGLSPFRLRCTPPPLCYFHEGLFHFSRYGPFRIAVFLRAPLRTLFSFCPPRSGPCFNFPLPQPLVPQYRPPTPTNMMSNRTLAPLPLSL